MKNILITIILTFCFSNPSIAINPNPVPTKGLLIDKVEVGGPYEKVGLKVGDEVISYDRKPLRSPKDALDFYNQAKLKKIKIMLIVREGVQQNLYVK